MSKRYFTDEEIKTLRENPNTYKVGEATLSFTKEFKERFHREHLQGKTAREILRENGYSPEMLGKRRIEGFSHSISQQYKVYGEFHDAPLKPGNAKKTDGGQPTPEEELRKLRGEVEYLRQEVEFIKKISSARTTKD